MDADVQRSQGKQNPQLLWQERAFRERRGTGTGTNYIPWIQIRRFDLNSRGRSHVFLNPLIGEDRQHHVLSDLELDALLLLMWAGVRDIREQFPLQLEFPEDEFLRESDVVAGSVAIAKRLGIKHPAIKKGSPRVMTSDFLVTHHDGTYTAIYVKYSHEIEAGRGERLEELLQIAREYWSDRGVPLIEVTERDIPRNMVDWCVWAHDALHEMQPREMRRKFARLLLETDPYDRIGVRLDHVARLIGVRERECRLMLKQAIFLRELSIDFREPADMSMRWALTMTSPNDPIPSWHFLSKARCDVVRRP